jgi:hypothetical protein
MATRMASDEVTDGIAAIEMHRQGTEKESGLAVSVSEALRKLQELLAQEKEALQLNGPDSVSALNVEVVANEIKRVQAMGGGKGPRQVPNNARPRDRQQPRLDKAHNAPRNRGRRTMGRTGGRGGGGGGAGGGGGGGSGGR